MHETFLLFVKTHKNGIFKCFDEYTALLQIFHVSGLLLDNIAFQLSPKIFFWVHVWRLARSLQDPKMFLTEQLLDALAVFWIIVILEDPVMVHI